MEVKPIDELRANGRITWIEQQRAWEAQPDEIVSALGRSGFHENKREEARTRRDRQPAGGMWQGINESGAVASAVWVHRTDAPSPIVYIDIDGEPLHA